MKRLLQLMVLAAFVWMGSYPEGDLQARYPNCYCQGNFTGFLPLVLLDPVCTERVADRGTEVETYGQCNDYCEYWAINHGASLTCGEECVRDGYTYPVNSYTYQYSAWVPYFGAQFAGSGANHLQC